MSSEFQTARSSFHNQSIKREPRDSVRMHQSSSSLAPDIDDYFTPQFEYMSLPPLGQTSTPRRSRGSTPAIQRPRRSTPSLFDSQTRGDNYALAEAPALSGSVVCLPPHVRVKVTQPCDAIKRSGQRCGNDVVLNASQIAALQRAEKVTAYCGKHLPGQAPIIEKGTELSRLLPNYLSKPAQVALKEKMAEYISRSDESGFIYIDKILDSPKGVVKLRVGRICDRSERREESDWAQYCDASAVERYLYPGGGNRESDISNRRESKYQPPLRWSQRVEELVRIELVDIMQSRAYLDPAWPECAYDYGRQSAATTVYFTTCDCCGKRHQDVYQFERRKAGREWKDIIRPIIKKWAKYVETNGIVAVDDDDDDDVPEESGSDSERESD